ncbi:MAG: hypothetical protein E6Q88_06330 [Lysobacteraceae bacterium]|nr:MAG: hypothetical protein E6Q88_06330 [Xanthomonadaceae bacterium]
MIDRLSSLSALMAALRAESTRKNARPEQRPAADEIESAKPRETARPRDRAALREQIAAIARETDPDDPQALAAAATRVVRAVLLWEYGPEIREYPEWRPMLDTLAQAVAADRKLSRDFASMLRELRA